MQQTITSTHTDLDFLTEELNWLSKCLSDSGLSHAAELSNLSMTEAPEIRGQGVYAHFVSEHLLSDAERLVLILALAPHLQPKLLETYGVDAVQRQLFKLVQSATKNVFLPTGETAIHLIAGSDLSKRLEVYRYFDADHVFSRKGVLTLQKNEGSSSMDAELLINADYVDAFLFNSYRKPKYSKEFPAHLLQTQMEWEDLVLNPITQEKIQEMKDAIHFYQTLAQEWGLGKHLKKGYRAVFYGPSGTGKSLTASLLGKSMGRDVYRVDLSAIISKYIGETEENIARLLRKSEDKGYILFFDEGDALFGSRAKDAQNSNDQHHNQLIGYLLQAIENFDGIIILATNLKANLDEAFSRRFQSSIYFGVPKPEQGLQLWKSLWPEKLKMGPTLNFQSLVVAKPFTAAMIVQIIQTLALQAIRKQEFTVGMADIKRVSDELMKK
ncbi:ATP-binding protein [Persicobacter psychrovividus]|uniref:AAA+ ATPase domain-containing protein n=1 Tax=Persicobacter psychrovividus TaxID=387638 RepID=A0ABM7VJZ9_9BACT|nr:hypothetical protein PEPS_35990 [Persicobacter psychrovividus]